jgi:hypothetical protein
MLPVNFRLIWSSGFRGFLEIDKPEHELSMAAMFVNGL